MPELPEVETIRRGLEPALAGARLARVVTHRPDLRFPFPDGFAQRLTGARIEALGRRAKYLLAPLDRGETLIAHLGMTGRFEIAGCGTPGRFDRAAPADPRHAHVVFETDAGVIVTFFDPRRFGYMDLVPSAGLAEHPWFKGLGPEPLEPGFDGRFLRRALAGRRAPIKTALLDQRLVAGLGNIYVCEALHRAQLAPDRPSGSIPLRRLERLADAVKEILLEAIEAGGSTLRDFASAEGGVGYFQHSFAAYGREGEPCLRAGCRGVIERSVQSGRSTFACNRCQR
jgi:formamidopyrimidine-DNA glycosylase